MKYIAVKTVLSLLLAAGLSACVCRSLPENAENFDVHRMYGSHMVLQQEKTIVFTGSAEPGRSVAVEFAGQTVRPVADATGTWRAEFPAMKADGRKYLLKVSGKDGKEIIFSDIMLGEVWICAGQSNMEMPVWSELPFWRAKDAAAERAAADYPEIRLFNSIDMRRTSPRERLLNENGPGWVRCTPETVANFSALGYFFGRDIHRTRKVPVGLVNIAWGGTPIEAWISEEAFRRGNYRRALNLIESARHPDPKEAERERQEEEAFRTAYANWFKRFYNWNATATADAKTWLTRDFDDSAWAEARFPYGIPDDVDGVAVFRCTFDLPENLAGADLECFLGVIDDCDETFLNGEPVGSTTYETSDYWAVKRTYKLPGRLLKPGRNVLVCRVADFLYGGGLGTEPKYMYLRSADGREYPLLKNWKYRLEYAVDSKVIGERPSRKRQFSEYREGPKFPSTLFNAMLSPWCVYPCRGVIWYQGCANAGQGDYAWLNSLLIDDWRKQFQAENLPFLLVQLAGFELHHPANRLPDDDWKTRSNPNHHPYALTREMQAEMLRLPSVGMATAIDLGDSSDIHPRDKQTLAWRLAREAERVCYGAKELTQGPIFERMTVEGDRVRVFFRNVGKGLTTSDGKAPGAFALAGADGKFVWAEAELDGDTVLVRSSRIGVPVAVRYAWTSYRGDVNLRNKDGFAALPFRSDKPDYVLFDRAGEGN